MVNKYTGITDYYDLLMQSGYYDYQNIAKEVHSIVGDGRQIIEIGVGTGLLAQKYIEIDPNCQFTGIDITPSMLEMAKIRLGSRVELIEADMLTMSLNSTFDVAISNGGVWLFIECENQQELVSHIPQIQENIRGLTNLARHLRKDGLFLLNLQQPGVYFEKHLPGDIVYSHSIEELEETIDYHTRQKSYFFKKNSEILAHEKLTITLFRQAAYQKLFSDAGFEYKGFSQNRSMIIYKKSKNLKIEA